MASEWNELLKRSVRVSSRDPSVTVSYFVTGAATEAVIDADMRTQTPATLMNLSRLNYDADELGAGNWSVKVAYGLPTDNDPALGDTPLADQTFPTAPTDFPGQGDLSGDPPDTSGNPSQAQDGNAPLGPEWSFDTKGGTRHVTQSIATVSKTRRFALDVGPAPDFKGAIGVSKDGVAGVDIGEGKLRITYTAQFPFITLNYLITLEELTYTVNDDDFFQFEIGTVLFTGASGSYKRGQRLPWSITYEFEISKNRENIEICDGLTVPLKGGHDYLWVSYSNFVHSSGVGVLPDAAYVEMMFYPADLAALGI